MISQFGVAEVARVIGIAADVLERNHVVELMIVSASGLFIHLHTTQIHVYRHGTS